MTFIVFIYYYTFYNKNNNIPKNYGENLTY